MILLGQARETDMISGKSSAKLRDDLRKADRDDINNFLAIRKEFLDALSGKSIREK